MGFLGISAHKVRHIHTMQTVPLNDGWIPDPARTAAMKAVVTGNQAANGVLDAIKTGGGIQLRNFFHFATKLYKKRNMEVVFHIVKGKGGTAQLGDDLLLKAAFPDAAGKPIFLVQEWRIFTESGAKFFDDMKRKFHIDAFTDEGADGTNVEPSSPIRAEGYLKASGSLGNTWVIGLETKRNIPAIILDPKIDKTTIQEEVYVVATAEYTPEPSKGIVAWATDAEETIINPYTEVSKQKKSLFYLINDVEYKKKTEPILVEETFYWDKENPTTEVPILRRYTDAPEFRKEYQELLAKFEEEFTKYKNSLGTDKVLPAPVFNPYKDMKYREYDEVQYYVESKLPLNKELIAYVTQDGKESVKGLNATLARKFDGSSEEKELTLPAGFFQFYPYIPLKETGIPTGTLIGEKVQKYREAAVLLRNLMANAEESEVDAPKAERDNNKREAFKEREELKRGASRDMQRTVANSAYYLRQVKINAGQRDYEYGDGWKLNKLTEMLGERWKNAVAETGDDTYFNCILPAVSFTSNLDEVNKYWYDFFLRIYKETGVTTETEFLSAVSALPSDTKIPVSGNTHHYRTLPRYRLTWGTHQVHGRMEFAYIKRFKIKTRTRKTERKRNLCDIKIGQHIFVSEMSLNGMKYALTHLPEEPLENIYHKSKAGKEYVTGLAQSDKVDRHGVVTDYSVIKDPTLRKYAKDADEYFTNKGSNPLYDKADSPGFNARRQLLEKSRRKNNYAMAGEGNNEEQLADRMYEAFGYTFFCKQLDDDGTTDVIAVAGLTFATRTPQYSPFGYESKHIDGGFASSCAAWELANFWGINYQKYISKKPNPELPFVTLTAGGGKNGMSANLTSCCVVPLDFNLIKKMGGLELLRFSDRAVVSVQWSQQRVRSLRKWVGTAIRIVTAIVAIVISYYFPPAGAAISTASSAFINALVSFVVSTIISKVLLQPLMRALGLKGVFAIIAAIAIIVITRSYVSPAPNNSALPMAVSLPVNQVTNVTTQMATQSVTEGISAAIKESILKAIKQLLPTTTDGLINFATKSIGILSSMYQQENAVKLQKLQEQAAEERGAWEKAMGDLAELMESKEATYAPYNVQEVMEAFLGKTLQAVPPEQALENMTELPLVQAQEPYLSTFLAQMLELTPYLYHPISSINFNLSQGVDLNEQSL